uniref:RNase III domain-containing protein n=1 Tax=Trichobilharzia regenti TaxID=157069 RepID=A0AA85J347_TRIRE|nr:unnamed protein product [Trichobilharzia regenti]
MWMPPVCDNPPPLKIEDELLPSTLGTETPTVSFSSSSSSDNQENSQYQAADIRFEFYPVPRARCLSFPYQALPSHGTTVYLYTWTVPAPDVVAKLCWVKETCFEKTDGAIGLLFSKPISKKEYVCRIPLYLTRGMARSRVRLVGKLTLSERELESIESAHSVICELITNMGHLSHVGQKPSSQALCDLMEKQKDPNEIPESCGVTLIDRFTDMVFSPEKANILALMTLIQLPAGTIDYEGIKSLVNWSICRTNSLSSDIKNNNTSGSVKIRPVRGILPSWPVRLSEIPREDWLGLVVRPIHVEDKDPGMFAISEVCPETPVSYVPQYVASKLSNTQNVGEVTYLDFYRRKYPVMRGLPVDNSMPLCRTSRLTRHQNCTQVGAGLRKGGPLPIQSAFVCEGCLVHPLSSWLWFLVSTIPAVFHQMTRALLASQLSTELASELKNPKPFCQMTNPSNMTDDSLSAVTVFVPDRLRDTDSSNGEPIKASMFDFEVDEQTSKEDQEMDSIAASECRGVGTVCPQPSDLIEPTTLLGARDAVNLERLEFYGDSFLHLMSTLSVYHTSPQDAGEGHLNCKRASLISNVHLCEIARNLSWYGYCTGRVFSPSEHFVPPCYTVSSEVSKYDDRLYIRLYNKSLADMVEALIGCFVVHIGLPSAVNLLYYLQICPVDWNTIKCDTEYKIDAPWHYLLHSENSDIASSSNSRRQILRVSSQNSLTTCIYRDLNEKYFDLQLKLDYRFRNIELLATAMTHQSSTNREYWGNYQRLEFLGDSVLGFIVSNRLFKKCPHASPGELSKMRSIIVSNNNLVNTVVENELYAFIDSGVCDIKPFIDDIESIHQQTDSICERIELLMKKVGEGSNVKILADVFESILGAIFVDSNGNHSVLSSIILRFLGRSIKYCIDSLPKNPIQQLHSSQGSTGAVLSSQNSQKRYVSKHVKGFIVCIIGVCSFFFVINASVDGNYKGCRKDLEFACLWLMME